MKKIEEERPSCDYQFQAQSIPFSLSLIRHFQHGLCVAADGESSTSAEAVVL